MKNWGHEMMAIECQLNVKALQLIYHRCYHKPQIKHQSIFAFLNYPFILRNKLPGMYQEVPQSEDGPLTRRRFRSKFIGLLVAVFLVTLLLLRYFQSPEILNQEEDSNVTQESQVETKEEIPDSEVETENLLPLEDKIDESK